MPGYVLISMVDLSQNIKTFLGGVQIHTSVYLMYSCCPIVFVCRQILEHTSKFVHINKALSFIFVVGCLLSFLQIGMHVLV